MVRGSLALGTFAVAVSMCAEAKDDRAKARAEINGERNSEVDQTPAKVSGVSSRIMPQR